MANEKQVRDFVRNYFPGSEWVEPARGATNGLPDVTIVFRSGSLIVRAPAELKSWDLANRLPGEVEDKFSAVFRREQIRYHYVTNKVDPESTFILFNCPQLLGKLFSLPGIDAPRKTHSLIRRSSCLEFERSLEGSLELMTAILTHSIYHHRD